jgi:hypothetical protein
MNPTVPTPREVQIAKGQTIVLYSGTSILLRAVAAKDTRYFTAWHSIIGTEAEVNAKIAELKLS